MVIAIYYGCPLLYNPHNPYHVCKNEKLVPYKITIISNTAFAGDHLDTVLSTLGFSLCLKLRAKFIVKGNVKNNMEIKTWLHIAELKILKVLFRLLLFLRGNHLKKNHLMTLNST